MRGFDPAELKAIREAAGVSQAELARQARVGLNTVKGWEAGSVSPQVDKLRMVVRALGKAVSDVVSVSPSERFPGDIRIIECELTQPELGRRAGLSTATVGAVERGEVPLSAAAAQRLADALGVSPDELVRAHDRARLRAPNTPA